MGKGAKADFDGAKVYARLAAGGDPEGMAAYLRWCGFLARETVEKNWDQIGRFARRLADAGELEGCELKAALMSGLPSTSHGESRSSPRAQAWAGPATVPVLGRFGPRKGCPR
jgi:hypothetical protein